MGIPKFGSKEHLRWLRGIEAGLKDESAAAELTLYITNDSALYNSIIVPTCKAMARKKHKGVYDDNLALVQWVRVVKEGAKKYGKEHLDGRQWSKVFHPTVRNPVALELRQYYAEYIDELVEELGKGNRI